MEKQIFLIETESALYAWDTVLIAVAAETMSEAHDKASDLAEEFWREMDADHAEDDGLDLDSTSWAEVTLVMELTARGLQDADSVEWLEWLRDKNAVTASVEAFDGCTVEDILSAAEKIQLELDA